jgi:hypothetical protein
MIFHILKGDYILISWINNNMRRISVWAIGYITYYYDIILIIKYKLCIGETLRKLYKIKSLIMSLMFLDWLK